MKCDCGKDNEAQSAKNLFDEPILISLCKGCGSIWASNDNGLHWDVIIKSNHEESLADGMKDA